MGVNVNPGAIIQRVTTHPIFATQYLALDGKPPTWSGRRIDAMFFSTHREADDTAKLLREATGEAIFAVVATAPDLSRRAKIDPVPPVHFPPAKKRETRAERAREEMRKQDLAQRDQLHDRTEGHGIVLETKLPASDYIAILHALEQCEEGVRMDTTTRLFIFFAQDGIDPRSVIRAVLRWARTWGFRRFRREGVCT